jgi:hypothetical protein
MGETQGSALRFEVNAPRLTRVGWLPRWGKLRVVGSQEFLMLPRGFIFRVIIPLDLVDPSNFVVCDSVVLVKNLDEISLLCQIWFQWNGVFLLHKQSWTTPR